MPMSAFINASQILRVFESHLDEDKLVSHSVKTGVWHFSYSGKRFAAFAKNICHGGNSYEAYVHRAQLPKNKEFDKIEADETFLFLGYSETFDVFACWDVNVVKSRLNKRKYVSFFCRHDIPSVECGQIVQAKLSNGLRYCLFKSSEAGRFLVNVDSLFSAELSLADEFPLVKETILVGEYGGRKRVDGDSWEDEVSALIERLIVDDGLSDLAAVSVLMNKYADHFPNRTLKTWLQIVKSSKPA